MDIDLKGDMLAVLRNSLVLAQVFVLIFFFENYLIYFNHPSLFLTTLDFKHIPLHPFVTFFFFVAFFRVLWAGFHLLWTFIRGNWWINDFILHSNVVFTAFLLSFLIGCYLWNITFQDSFTPVNEVEHPILNSIFYSFVIVAFSGCVFVTLTAQIDYPSENKQKKRA
jgi:hypothetical protein